MTARKAAGRAKTSRTAGPKITTRNVSPDLAKKWLDSNTHNRNLRYRLIRAFAEDIRAREWRMNGETIKFDYNGILIDGQHRLAAIVEADMAIDLLVVEGLEPEDQETIDTGARRTMNDILKLRGERNTTHLAATLRRIWLYKHGTYTPRGAELRPTPHQLLKLLESREGKAIRDSVRYGQFLYPHVRCSVASVALCYWACMKIDPDDAELFFARLGGGSEVRGEPARECREVLRDRAVRKVTGREHESAALIFKAWNAYRDGVRVKRISWTGGGARPEPFPLPK